MSKLNTIKALRNIFIELDRIDTLSFPELEDMEASLIKIRDKYLIKGKSRDGKSILQPNPNLSKEKQRDYSESLRELSKEIKKFSPKEESIITSAMDHILKKAEELGHPLCYMNDSVYIYNGCYWEVFEEGDFKKELLELDSYFEVSEVTRFKMEHKFRLNSFNDKMFDYFCKKAYVSKPNVNPNVVLINLKNVTLEITKGKIEARAFDYKDFFTYQLDFEYNPDAEAPIFNKFINRVLPDEDAQNVVSEYIGYLFVRNGSDILKLEKALMLYGSGANGKSVFYEVINAMIGKENVTNFDLNGLTDEKGNQRAQIENKLVNYCSDAGKEMNTPIFKQLVSGEPVQAKFLYKDAFLMRNYAKLIFNTNELPVNVEHTDGFFRRFFIVPFSVTIPVEERDASLHKKIINSELPGVLNWAIRGLERLLDKKRFTSSVVIENQVNDFRDSSDSVLSFVKEKQYQKINNGYEAELISSIYNKYKEYCEESGIKFKVQRKVFKNRLISSGIEVKDTNRGTCVFLKQIKSEIESDSKYVYSSNESKF